jgi:hypothetical protein
MPGELRNSGSAQQGQVGPKIQSKPLCWNQRWPLNLTTEIRSRSMRKRSRSFTLRNGHLLPCFQFEQAQIGTGECFTVNPMGPRVAFICALRQSPPSLKNFV